MKFYIPYNGHDINFPFVLTWETIKLMKMSMCRVHNLNHKCYTILSKFISFFQPSFNIGVLFQIYGHGCTTLRQLFLIIDASTT